MTSADEQRFLNDLDKKLWSSADKLRSNLDAAVYLASLVLPSMIAQERGAVINISSLSGRHTAAGNAAYSAAKHAPR